MFKWPLGKGKQPQQPKPEQKPGQDADAKTAEGSSPAPAKPAKPAKPAQQQGKSGNGPRKEAEELAEKLQVAEIINQKLRKDNRTLLDSYNELRKIWRQSIQNEVATVASQHIDEAMELRTLVEVLEQELGELSEENSQLYIGVWNLLQKAQAQRRKRRDGGGGKPSSPSPGAPRRIRIPVATRGTDSGDSNGAPPQALTPSPGAYPTRSRFNMTSPTPGSASSPVESPLALSPASDEPELGTPHTPQPVEAARLTQVPDASRREYTPLRPPSAPTVGTGFTGEVGSVTTVAAVGQRIGRVRAGRAGLPPSSTTAEDLHEPHDVANIISPPRIRIQRWQSEGSPSHHHGRTPTTAGFGVHAFPGPPVTPSPDGSESVSLAVDTTGTGTDRDMVQHDNATGSSPRADAAASPNAVSPAAAPHRSISSKLIHGGGIWTDIRRPPPLAAPIPMLIALKSILRKRGTTGAIMPGSSGDPMITHGSVPLPTGDVARKNAIVEAFRSTLRARAGLAKAKGPGEYALAVSRLALTELLDRRRLTLAMFGADVMENPSKAVIIQPGHRRGATLCAMPMLATFDAVAHELRLGGSLASMPWQPPLYRNKLEYAIATWRRNQLPQAWKDLIREPVIILNGQPYPVGTLDRLLRLLADLRTLVSPMAASIVSKALQIPKTYCGATPRQRPPAGSALETRIKRAVLRARAILATAPPSTAERYFNGNTMWASAAAASDDAVPTSPLQALHALVRDCVICDIMLCASRTTAGGDAYVQVSQVLSVPGSVSVMGEHARLSSPIEIMVVPPDSVFIMTVARFRACTTPGLTIWPLPSMEQKASDGEEAPQDIDHDHGPIPWLSIKSTVAEAVAYSLDPSWEDAVTTGSTSKRGSDAMDAAGGNVEAVELGKLTAPSSYFLPLKREGLRRLQMALHGLHGLRDAVHAAVRKPQSADTKK